MRWFIVFLLVANVVLFFWVQQQLRPPPGMGELPPPEVGRLRLMSEVPKVIEIDGVAQSSAGSLTNSIEEAQPANREEKTDRPQEVKAMPARVEADLDVPATEAAVSTASVATRQAVSVPPETGLPDLAVATTEFAPQTAGPPELPPSTDAPAELPAVPVFDSREPAQELPKAVCARLGPFDPKDADTLIAKLPTYLQLLSDTSEEYAHVDGYYVLIPALSSRAEGLRKLQELEEAGIKDTWLFRAGELNNAISLGLFRREASARRHAAQVKKKGFSAELMEKTSLKERRWLQLKAAAGEDPAASLPLPEGVGATRLTCP